jgi:phosphoglycolate phosphatase
VGKPLIVFDLDGTLLDSRETAMEGHRLAVEAMGLPPVSQEVLAALNGPNSEQSCRILGISVSRRAEFEAVMERIDDVILRQRGKLFPGVLSMLHELSAEATLGLLTNGSPAYMELACQVTGMTHCFAERTGFVPGFSKQDRIRAWQSRHGAPRALMVGDRAGDVAAAHAAGALAIGAVYGVGAPDELAQADALAADIRQVHSLCLAFLQGAWGGENRRG